MELTALEASILGFAVVAGASTVEATAAANKDLQSLLRATAL